eukprot:1150228-Pelagomonas_calceolata.AAC.1
MLCFILKGSVGMVHPDPGCYEGSLVPLYQVWGSLRPNEEPIMGWISLNIWGLRAAFAATLSNHQREKKGLRKRAGALYND